MRLLILKTGTTAAEVRGTHGDYERWFTDALAHHPLSWEVRDVTRDGASAETDGIDGILVTGSVKSVCEPEPWMDRNAAQLRGGGDAAPPILAVCFGCQWLAAARGGRVTRNPEGWEIGAADVVLAEEARRDPLFEGIASPMPILATHEDRVESLPPGAVRLAGNANSAVQAFRAAPGIWGVQFHPEATPAILDILIRLRRERLEREAAAPARHGPGRVDRLLRGLDGFDPLPSRRLLDNFVRFCRERGERRTGWRAAVPR
ncbi:MAG: glutamine amidotransferase-related protein [Candidatus Polarisedimenticolia bacterium]